MSQNEQTATPQKSERSLIEDRDQGSKARIDTLVWLLYDTVMYSEEFVKLLSRKNQRTQKYYRTALTSILAELQEQLKEGNKVTFPGFGTFYTRIPGSKY
ncbi:MAG: HU family DNA-binding protein [Ktedonobacteraceae bacterium]